MYPGGAAGGQGVAESVRTRRALLALTPAPRSTGPPQLLAFCHAPTQQHPAPNPVGSPETQPCREPPAAGELLRMENSGCEVPRAGRLGSSMSTATCRAGGRGRGASPPAGPHQHFPSAPRARGARRWPWWQRDRTEPYREPGEREERVSEGGCQPGPGGTLLGHHRPWWAWGQEPGASHGGSGSFYSLRERSATCGHLLSQCGAGPGGAGRRRHGWRWHRGGAGCSRARAPLRADPGFTCRDHSGPKRVGARRARVALYSKGQERRSGPGARLRNVICLLGRQPQAPRVPAATCPTDPLGNGAAPSPTPQQGSAATGGAAPQVVWSPQPTWCPWATTGSTGKLRHRGGRASTKPTNPGQDHHHTSFSPQAGGRTRPNLGHSHVGLVPTLELPGGSLPPLRLPGPGGS